MKTEIEYLNEQTDIFLKFKNTVIATFAKTCYYIPKKKLLIIPSLLDTEYIRYKYFMTKRTLIVLILDELKNTGIRGCKNLELVYSFIKDFKSD